MLLSEGTSGLKFDIHAFTRSNVHVLYLLYSTYNRCLTEPWPQGFALAFNTASQAKAAMNEAVVMPWLGLTYLRPA